MAEKRKVQFYGRKGNRLFLILVGKERYDFGQKKVMPSQTTEKYF